jgi:predicted ester cyclase
MPPDTPAGPEEELRYRAMLLAAFPDLCVKIEDVVAEGDLVAVRATRTGTHRGTFAPMPLPATNRIGQLSGMVFWRIRDDKLVERWATLDRMGLYQQLTEK